MKRIKPTEVVPRSPWGGLAPDKDFGRLLGIGDVHFGADNAVSALEYYERALVVARESHADPSDVLEIELRIADTLHRRGHRREALAFAEDLLARQDADGDRTSYARVLARLGTAQGALHRYDAARENCLAAYEILRSTDANREIASLELTLGVVAHFSGRSAEARTHYESALSTFRRIDDSEGIARALNNLGTLLINTPRWREAKEYLSRAVSVAEEGGNYARIASLSLNLGILSYKTCEWELATAYLARALAISKETAPQRVIKVHLALGIMNLRRGEYAAAEAHFSQTLEAARKNSQPREEALALEFLGERALREGELSRAEDFLERARVMATEVSPANDVVGEVETRRAELALAKGDAEEARRLADGALEICRDIDDAVEVGRALRIRGQAQLALGLTHDAAASLEEAVRVLDGTPDALEKGRAHVARAVSWARAECSLEATSLAPSRARMALEQSSLSFLDLDLPEMAVECLEEVARVAEATHAIDDALVAVDRALELAEKHGSTRRRSALLSLRANLEQCCAESSLSRSIEFQLLRDISVFGPDVAEGSVSAYLQLASQKVGADRVLFAVRARGEGVRIESHHGFGAHLPSRAMLATLFEELAGGTRVLVIGDPRRDTRLSLSGDVASEVVSAAAIPLPLAGDELGLLYADRKLGSPGGRFRVGDLRLLSFFAGILGVFLTAREGERRARLDRSEPEAEPGDALSRFLTCDAEMKRSIGLLRKLDRSDAGVLVTGETGTGKGLLSRLIHDSGRRSGGPFVPINCAALPESLLESELFGHEQGAFTGAVRAKRGLFEEAEGGTLLLDEVDKAPLGVQAKLLHVLDKHEIRPVGSTQWKPVDVRVVCATNVDLRQAIESGRFLEDLYYRLNDFQVHIPPLRERRADIPLLVRHFLEEFREDLGRQNVTFGRDVIATLTDHDWRGNVRELEKVIKRVLVLAEDGEQIGIDALPREMRAGQRVRPTAGGRETLRSAIERLEADLIGSCLEAVDGNKSEVARRLQVSYPCLLSKIKKYGLEPPRR